MFPYIVNYYKKPRREKAKSLGLATDCLIDKEIESITRIWKGEYSESVKILDKIIPKIAKYKRGGIAGTEYNQSSFIIPMITPEEIARENSENTTKKSYDGLLQDLLAEGYHMVFEEIYNMIKTDLEERKEYEKIYGVLKTKPLMSKLKTLGFISTYLKNAETAKNNDDFKSLFKCYLNLALKFSEQRNSLAERFFDHCLSIVSSYPCDSDGSSLALTRYHLALYTSYKGNYEKAYKDMNFVYKFSKGQDNFLYLDDGKPIFQHATHHLVDICLNVAQIKMNANQVREGGTFFFKAHKFATESMNSSLIVEAMRHLGNFFAVKRQFAKALQTLTECLEMCEKLQDKKRIATVCQSIGSIYFKLDDLDKAKGYYQKFVEVSDEGQDKGVLAESYLKTGYAFNNAGHYGVAVQYSKEAYKMTRENSEVKPYEREAKCLYGVARAHSLYSRYTPLFYTKDPDNLLKLLFWKNDRINQFVGPFIIGDGIVRNETMIKERIKALDEQRGSIDLVSYLSHIHRLYDLDGFESSKYNLSLERIGEDEDDEDEDEDEEDEEEEGEEEDEEEEEEEMGEKEETKEKFEMNEEGGEEEEEVEEEEEEENIILEEQTNIETSLEPTEIDNTTLTETSTLT